MSIELESSSSSSPTRRMSDNMQPETHPGGTPGGAPASPIREGIVAAPPPLQSPRTSSSATPSASSASGKGARNREGILSRQHSQHQQALSESDGNSPFASAAEDDEGPVSDSGPMPRRFPIMTHLDAAGSSSSLSSQKPPIYISPTATHPSRPSPLSSAASSYRQGDLSAPPSPVNYASSSRYPSASASSQYRDFMNNPSSRSRNASDDGSTGGLSRAKSISSVSSVTSTSSMEAAPFRAPPLGNIRMSYVGQVSGRLNGRTALVGLPDRGHLAASGSDVGSGDDQVGMSDFAAAANLAAAIQQQSSQGTPASESAARALLQQAPSGSAATPRARGHVPKASADAWLYRNAPGMGSQLGGKPIPGTYRGIQSIGNAAGSSPSGRRPSAVIRSKLVKSAYKLGVKPLTIIPGTTPAQARAAAHFSESASTTNTDLQVQQDLVSSVTSAAGADVIGLRGASRGVLLSTSGTGNGGLLSDAPVTSAATNAPLIVPKLSIVPLGQSALTADVLGPLSPGGGIFASTTSLPVSPVVTSEALGDPDSISNPERAAGPLGGLPSPSLVPNWAKPPSRPSSRASSRRPSMLRLTSSQRDVGGPIARSTESPPMTPTERNPLQDSWLMVPEDSPKFTGHSSPTPAEIVRMEAQAGIARLPTEGSGPTPGPTPIPRSSQNLQVRSPLMSPGQTLSSSAGTGNSTLLVAKSMVRSSASSVASSAMSSPTSGVAKNSAAFVGGSLRPAPSRRLTSESHRSGASNNSEGSSSNASTAEGRTSPVDRRGRIKGGPNSPTAVLKNFRWSGPAGRPAAAGMNATPGSKLARETTTAHVERDSSASPSGSVDRSPFADAADLKSGRVSGERSSVAHPLVLSAHVAPLSHSDLDETARLKGSHSRVDGVENFKASPELNAQRSELAPPPPMVRGESAVSKAISDTSDAISLPPLRRPPPTVAGRILGSELPRFSTEGEAILETSQTRMDSYQTDPALIEEADNSKRLLNPISEQASEATKSDEKSSPAKTSAQSQPSTAKAQETNLISANTDGQSSTQLHKPRGRDDFEFGDILGEGSYSTVMLAWDLLSNPSTGVPDKPTTTVADAMSGAGSGGDAWIRANKRAYAIKVLDKVHILKERKQKYVSVEKEAMSRLIKHPGVITLYWTFQDAESLYFVTELAPNGELLTCIKRHGSFDEHTTRYYAAQLLDTIVAMHKAGVIHRDLKPENVLLDGEMRSKVIDFGSAKILPKEAKISQKAKEDGAGDTTERASSFVGTAEYVSPELLTDKSVSQASDLWALGCVIFQMLTGKPPFKGLSEYQTFQKIIKGEYEIPAGLSSDAQDLIRSLLVCDPAKRLGGDDAKEVKKHAFFASVSWNEIWTGEAPEIQTGIVQPTRAPSESIDNGEDWFVHDKWQSDGASSLQRASNSSDRGSASTNDRGSIQDNGIDTADQLNDRPDVISLASGHRADADGNDESATSDDSSDDSGVEEDPSAQRLQERKERGLSVGAYQSSQGRRGSTLGKLAASMTGSSANDLNPAKALRERFSVAKMRSSAYGETSTDAMSPTGGTPPSRSQRGSFSTAPSSGSPAGNESLSASHASSTSVVVNWAALLLPQESVLHASPITHRKTGKANLQSKKRMLILTDFPRLLCVKEDVASLKVKSEVLLSKIHRPRNEMHRGATTGGLGSQANVGPHLQTDASSNGASNSYRASTSAIPASANPHLMFGIEQKSGRSFVVHTPARAYTYDDPSGDGSNWVRWIKAASERRE